jgi:hypothetical protein
MLTEFNRQGKVGGIPISRNLNHLRKTGYQNDVTFDLGTVKVPAHKIVLSAASEYFSNLFFSKTFRTVGAIVPIGGIKPEIFELYLDYVYGQDIKIANWKESISLYRLIDYTQTQWPMKDRDLTDLDVTTADYIDYLHLLIELYHEDVPIEILKTSARFIKDYVDLAGLDPETIRVITHSPYFDPIVESRDKIYQNLVKKGYQYNQIVGAEELLTLDLKAAIRKRFPITVKVMISSLYSSPTVRGRARNDTTIHALTIFPKNLYPHQAEKVSVSFTGTVPDNDSVITINKYTVSYEDNIVITDYITV